MSFAERAFLAVIIASCAVSARAQVAQPAAPQGEAKPAAPQGSSHPAPVAVASAQSAEPRRGLALGTGGAPKAAQKAAEERVARAQKLKKAKQDLDSDDINAVQYGLTSLAELGGREAADAIVARLRRGLPPQLSEAAISSLAALKQPQSIPTLLELTLHRRFQVREQALDALSALKAKSAQSAVLYALDDPSPEVRRAAVRALGEIGDARALPALATAQERGVEGAELALGKLGGAKEADLLLGLATHGDLKRVEAGLLAMLQRVNVPAQLKRKIVSTLAGLGTPESQALVTASQAAPRAQPAAAPKTAAPQAPRAAQGGTP